MDSQTSVRAIRQATFGLVVGACAAIAAMATARAMLYTSRKRSQDGVVKGVAEHPGADIQAGALHMEPRPASRATPLPERAELEVTRSARDATRSDRDERIRIRVPVRVAHGALAGAAAAGLLAVAHLGIGTLPTTAAMTSSTSNPGNGVQAAVVRIAVSPIAGPAFTVPALLPGESVERVFTITQAGSVDATLALDVRSTSEGRLAVDPDLGLQLGVSACRGGAWTLPLDAAPGTPHQCTAAGSGTGASAIPAYQGPIAPRDLAGPGTALMAHFAVPISTKVAPGERVSVLVRASLPEAAAEWATLASAPDQDRRAVVSLDWRAELAATNVEATPLATRALPPPWSTPRPTVAPTTVPATPVPLAPTPFTLPTATVQPTPWATPIGYAGYALALDGAVDSVELTAGTVALANRDAWTIEAWIRPSTLTGPQAIYTENVVVDQSAAGMVLGVGLMDRKVVVGGWTGFEAESWTWSEAPLPDPAQPGQWQHLAVTRNAGDVNVYWNGAALGVATGPGAAWGSLQSQVPSTFYVGRAANPGEASFFAGEIDEVRTWTVARSGPDVAAGRRQRLRGSEAGLVTYLPVSTCPASDADGRGTAIRNVVTGASAGQLRGGVRYVASLAEVTAPPSPHGLALAVATDTGMPGDGVTSASTISISGLAEAGNVVTLYQGGAASSVTTLTADPSGSFTASFPATTDGTYTFSATAKGATGPEGVRSEPVSVVRDATPPPAPTGVALDPASDTYGPGTAGTASDRITRDATPTITGTATAGTMISMYDNGTPSPVAPQLDPVNGAFTWTPANALAEGPHALAARATDAAGNVSGESASVVVEVDTTANAPSISLATGGISTTDATPDLVVAGEAGAVATLMVGNSTIGSAILVGGSATVNVASQLANGPHAATATIVDRAGNQSTSSSFAFGVAATSLPACASRASPMSASGQVDGWVGAGAANCIDVRPSTASLTVDTCQSAAGMDTWIEVYDEAGTLIGQDDDTCGQFRSVITVTVVPNSTYTIRIRGFQWRALDAYTLRWQSN